MQDDKRMSALNFWPCEVPTTYVFIRDIHTFTIRNEDKSSVERMFVLRNYSSHIDGNIPDNLSNGIFE